MQEFLNRSDAHLWAVVSNGLRLRILRDNQALSRQSWLEFDLEAMFSGEVYPDFVLLWLVAHATRFAPRDGGPPDGGRPETCWLERWTREADRQGARALGELRGGVERALEILGAGFTGHPKNAALREALRAGAIGLDDFHGQLLRVVYRLIFLFVAEDRLLDGQPLLHPRNDSDAARTARERYAAYYGAARLRDLAGRIKGSRHGDLWRQFQIPVGALSGDPRFETARRALALPALGSFLWDPASTADLNNAELTNHDFLESLRRLAFIRQGRVLRPVDYRNLGAEELGGVYESLLALTPQLGGDGARFTFAEFAGNARKTSGSYYTPDALVQCLLDTALDPVVEAAIRGKTGAEAERAILDLKVCDPAVGSGHFLVGAAHRLARHLARVRAHSAGDSEPSPLLHQHALRDVIGRCLYGVDRNPMAAELCRVSLWLEALEPGKPLSFLDHHIRVGNSLLGATPELVEAGLPDEAFKPIQEDDAKVCSGLKRKNRVEREDVQQVMDLMVAEPRPEYGSIASLSRDIDESPDDTLDDVRRKEARFRRLIVSPRYRQKQRVADAWCAAFLWPKRAGDDPALCITTRTVRRLQADLDSGAGFGSAAAAGLDLDPSRNPDPNVGAGLDPESGIDMDRGPGTDLDSGADTGFDLAAGLDLGPGTNPVRSPGAGPRTDLDSGADALSPAQHREVERLARRYRFFHWDLAFPEVFENGGFDCVLGNPPWERVKLQEKEWFSERKPEVADAPTAAARKRMIQALKTDDFRLYRRFLDDLRESEGWSHLMRNTGRYPLCGRGDINLYAIFAEAMRNVVNERGRAGCVLPTGIATDDTTKLFFQDVMETGSLASLFDFENRSRIFPDVDSRMKFCLFTAGSGQRPITGQRPDADRQPIASQRAATSPNGSSSANGPPPASRFVTGNGQRPVTDRHRQPAAGSDQRPAGGAEFVFFAHTVEELRDPERRFTLSSEDIALLNPNTRTCPIFRSRKDAELTKAIYRRVPVLVREARDGRSAENPWGIQFNRMFDMSNDSHLFRTRAQLEAEGWELDGNVFRRDGDGAEYLPLYEAKMTQMYNHRAADVVVSDRARQRKAQPAPLDDTMLADPRRSAIPLYWIDERRCSEALDGQWDRDWLLGFTSVTSPTNERTMNSVVLPRAGAGNSMPVLLGTEHALDFRVLYANLCSFVFDYAVRQNIGGVNLNFYLVNQFPVLPPEMAGETCPWDASRTIDSWVTDRVLELTYTAWDLESFANDCGYHGPPFRWNEDRRFLLRCELDAAFFHLYLPADEHGDWRPAHRSDGCPQDETPEQLAEFKLHFPKPRDAVSYIMDTFPIVRRKDEETFRRVPHQARRP